MPRVLGLDIGGANLKAARADGVARTVAFPLWKHPDNLGEELKALCWAMQPYDRLAVTMTGELCDCFESQSAGVQAILQSVHAFAGDVPMGVWSLGSRFVEWHEAWANPRRVAAANWLALAHLVARRHAGERVLLIDAGSTTTDIVYLNQGQPEPRAFTDPERLTTGELVYTGLKRTPICAVLGMEVAAELFATMQDAYVLLALIPEGPEDRATADGRPATRAHAHARLARMLCADAEDFSADQARALAEHAVETQLRNLARAIERVCQGRPAAQRVVLSGSGEILGQVLCNRTPWLAQLPTTSLAELLGPEASQAACAYAVAMLASQEANGA